MITGETWQARVGGGLRHVALVRAQMTHHAHEQQEVAIAVADGRREAQPPGAFTGQGVGAEIHRALVGGAGRRQHAPAGVHLKAGVSHHVCASQHRSQQQTDQSRPETVQHGFTRDAITLTLSDLIV